MELLSLPDELLVCIIKYLDTPTKSTLFYTCNRFNKLLGERSLMKFCDLSYGANVSAFQSKLIKIYASHIEELNLSGIQNLTKTILKPVLKKMVNLRLLDITFTNVTIDTFCDIYAGAPPKNMKTLAMDFKWNDRFDYGIELFFFATCLQNVQYLHLVGLHPNILMSHLLFAILAEATKLNELRITTGNSIDGKNTVFDMDDGSQVGLPPIRKFSMVINDKPQLNTRVLYINLENWKIMELLDINEWELMCIQYHSIKINIILSSKLYDMSKSILKPNEVLAISKFEGDIDFIGACSVHMWHCSLFIENNQLAKQILQRVARRLPQFIWGSSCDRTTNELISAKGNVCYINTCPLSMASPTTHDSNDQFLTKRKRLSRVTNSVIDIDNLLENNNNATHLIFTKMCNMHGMPSGPLILGPNIKMLDNISFVSIVNIMKTDADFFIILLKNTRRLETLCVESTTITKCHTILFEYLHISKSVRNLKVDIYTDNGLDLNKLFVAVSDTPSLANIYVRDVSSGDLKVSTQTAIRGMIENCRYLFNIVILVDVQSSVRQKQLKYFKKAIKDFNMNNLCVVWESSGGRGLGGKYESITTRSKMFHPLYEYLIAQNY